MYQIGNPVSEVAKIRDSIDHPIIDADAHVIEARFALLDFVKKVAGPNVLAAYEKRQAGRNKTSQRNGFWASPSGDMTIDRATVMLPGPQPKSRMANGAAPSIAPSKAATFWLTS